MAAAAAAPRNASVVINPEQLVDVHNALNCSDNKKATEILKLVEEALDIIDRRHRIIPVVQFRGAIRAGEPRVLYWTIYYMVFYRFITSESIAAAKVASECRRIGIMTGYIDNTTMFYYSENADAPRIFVASLDPIEEQETQHNKVASLFTNIEDDVITYETIRVLAENGYFSALVLHSETVENFRSIGILLGQAIEIKIHFPSSENS